jgi:hypothetical protein
MWLPACVGIGSRKNVSGAKRTTFQRPNALHSDEVKKSALKLKHHGHVVRAQCTNISVQTRVYLLFGLCVREASLQLFRPEMEIWFYS